MRHLLLALTLTLMMVAAPAKAEVTVFAAASLKTALDDIAADYTATTGVRIVLSYGGTPALAKQIAQGAPADLFLSASTAWMDDLAAKGVIQTGSRRDLLGNSLILVAYDPLPPVEITPALDLVGLLGDGKLSMALVDAVPAGQYGKEALEQLGLWAGVEASVVQSENVRAALKLVETGEAPLGIVYASDAVAGDGVSVLGTFPADSHTPIVYPAALTVTSVAEAEEFLDYLETPEAEAVFLANGFLPVP
jgi:molybdate transport system substrate-binding protein